MDILEMGAQMLSENLGQNIDKESLTRAFSDLLDDGQGNIDLAGLASKMASSGELGNILNSWLGDGANAPISADKIMELLGQNQVADFASKIGASSSEAADSLANALPQLMDKSSSGGSLLDSVGGLGGLMDAAKSLLK